MEGHARRSASTTDQLNPWPSMVRLRSRGKGKSVGAKSSVVGLSDAWTSVVAAARLQVCSAARSNSIHSSSSSPKTIDSLGFPSLNGDQIVRLTRFGGDMRHNASKLLRLANAAASMKSDRFRVARLKFGQPRDSDK